jgi:hypothetical protein
LQLQFPVGGLEGGDLGSDVIEQQQQQQQQQATLSTQRSTSLPSWTISVLNTCILVNAQDGHAGRLQRTANSSAKLQAQLRDAHHGPVSPSSQSTPNQLYDAHQTHLLLELRYCCSQVRGLALALKLAAEPQRLAALAACCCCCLSNGSWLCSCRTFWCRSSAAFGAT